MNWHLNWQKRPYLPLIGIVLLAFSLRLYGLTSQNLWWDELKTWERATMPLNHMLADLMNIRDQVPFYYWVMQFWAHIGTDVIILRLFSVYLGTAGVALLYQIGHRLDGVGTGLLAAFLLAISPFHIWYSQEVRMYALLPALLLLAHFCLLRLLKNNRWQLWLVYGLAMTAALYTHYFAFLMVLVHYIFFVLHFRQIRRQTVSWFITMLLVGAAFAPWVYLVLTQTDGYGTAVPDWITLIHWSDLPLTLTVFAAGFGLGRASWLAAISAAVFILGIGSSLGFLTSKGTNRTALPLKTLHIRLLLIWLVLPLAITFLVSLENGLLPASGFSIYNDRYLIISLPPFLLLAALGWQRWRKYPVLFWPTVLLVTVISGMGLWQQTNDYAYTRSSWPTAFGQIQAICGISAVIIGEKNVELPVIYYGEGLYPFVQLPPPESEEITPAFAAAMAQQLALAAEQHNLVWHAEQLFNDDPHGFPEARAAAVASADSTPARSWLAAHYRKLQQIQLPGMRLTLYDLESTE
ncbi:MAG: glycosyltransferase family 39 protein [Ardenticatenaceae bacterium]|nr:glycosyltransferase family 39 protein [Ardenticatenaceae bacterium]